MTAPQTASLTLSRTQAAFVEDEHRYCGFVGGVGSGKSYAGAAKALMRHLGTRGLGLVYAPTYPMLRDATWRTALEVWAPIISEVARHEMRMTMRTGAEVLFRSADDPDRLRGPNAAWAWIDEGSLCHSDTFGVVIGRLRAGGMAGPCWVTFTPKGLDNWTYRVFVSDANQDTSIHRARSAANPFLPAEYVDALRRQYGSEYARQELGGEFVTLGAGLVRRSWFTVADAAPAGLTWARYWDLAASEKQSADYTASIRAAFDKDGMLWLADGIRGHWGWPEARRIILQTMAAEDAEVGVEAAGFQLAAFKDIMAQPESRGKRVRGITVDRDKLARAQPWIARAESGLVTLVRGSWVAPFLDEAEAFPEGGHDDQVDAVSGAVGMLAKRRAWGVA